MRCQFLIQSTLPPEKGFKILLAIMKCKNGFGNTQTRPKMSGEDEENNSSGLCSAAIVFAISVAMLVIGVQVKSNVLY